MGHARCERAQHTFFGCCKRSEHKAPWQKTILAIILSPKTQLLRQAAEPQRNQDSRVQPAG
eukprot:scaffold208524_cov14-Tisochrysis_lutea.AAC.1